MKEIFQDSFKASAGEELKKYQRTGLTPEQVKELKDRNTGKKIVVEQYKDIKFYSCPICNKPVHFKDHYCSECGQKLKLVDHV